MKKRLDLLVLERGLSETRAKAQAAIMAGQVLVEGTPVDKPGAQVAADSRLELKSEEPFVSRGGQKLAKALDKFAIDLEGRIVLDAGASTGGFTDCCLQAGALLVYAVDVGYGQLVWSLRTDPRVVSLERTNLRYLKKESFTRGSPDFACLDLSFISLGLVLPVLAGLGPRELVALVKPQFEVGRESVGKKGVVRDPGLHLAVLEKVAQAADAQGYNLWHLDYSPLRGPQGNIEYLAHFRRDLPPKAPAIPEAVAAAHAHFR